MFDSKHYVPILKWKPAEKRALEVLGDKEKKFISPLLQLVMPQPKSRKGEPKKTLEEQLEASIKTLKDQIPKIPAEILKFWGNTTTFIDFSLIDISLREEAFNQILDIGKNIGASLIPVINLNFDTKIKTRVAFLAKKNNSGICLRLFRSDFFSIPLLSEKIKNFLNEFSLLEKDIDLLIDFQITDEKCSNITDLCKKIPNLQKWRTFTFASGAFPVDLTEFKIGENIISRLDWNYWLKEINTKKLERNPSFADYTIQHPIYKEALQFFSPSASIKYTLQDNWLIMRGQKRKNIQYLANAQLLSKHEKFFGESFSYGDAFIMEKGKDLKGKPGNSTSWLIAGINHHLTCTADQIANLP